LNKEIKLLENQKDEQKNTINTLNRDKSNNEDLIQDIEGQLLIRHNKLKQLLKDKSVVDIDYNNLKIENIEIMPKFKLLDDLIEKVKIEIDAKN
jgi:hypothetical protein